MIQVLIADDHALIRQGLRQIVADEADITIAAEAQNGGEALALLRDTAIDVVILDLNMPGLSGIDILKRIRERQPNLPVLILSMYPEDQYALRMLKAGASGYMTKECAPTELVSAIRRVAAGKRYISATVAELMSEALSNNSDRLPHELLSDREYQVLCMIASGKPVSVIANEMVLSVKTISTYRSRILEKMQLQNNAELTHYAIRHQLV
jgi:two-component system, NarL family, invasion response regulator UvrY